MAVDTFVRGKGFHQGDLVDLLASIVTKWNATLTKLDADGTVTDTNYNALWALTMPSTIQTVDPKCIRDQGALVSILNSMALSLNGALAKLDADATVSGTDYASLWAITDTIGAETDSVKDNGIYDGSMINFLDTWITKYAGVLAKLDADGGVADTNYASLNGQADIVDSDGTVARVA